MNKESIILYGTVGQGGFGDDADTLITNIARVVKCLKLTHIVMVDADFNPLTVGELESFNHLYVVNTTYAIYLQSHGWTGKMLSMRDALALLDGGQDTIPANEAAFNRHGRATCIEEGVSARLAGKPNTAHQYGDGDNLMGRAWLTGWNMADAFAKEIYAQGQ